jgi:chemotaxis protein methyltransferase CheR
MILKPREQGNDRRLRIWSAGCSSGEEPYTLAIILREVMHDFDSWDIKIKATDIDQERLEMARRAVYE